MKLTSSLRLVKPTPHTFTVACLATLLTAACLAATWKLTDDSQLRTDAYGTNLALGLARLTIEPLLKQDRIALGVLANRTLELPEVVGVTVFTVDDQVLAARGEADGGLRYTTPVTFDDTIMGYVRVTLGPQANQSSAATVLLGLLSLLFAPLAAVGIFSVRYLPASAPAIPTVDMRGTNLDGAIPDDVAVAAQDHHLVAINLYNQISMTRETRRAELDHAQAIAEQVAALYLADVQPLPGTGLLVHFAPSSDDDRALQVLCATFVLTELLQHAMEDVVSYRLSLHTVALPAGCALQADAREIADVALLSAMAKPRTVAVSDAFPLDTLRHDQVHGHLLQHPLLDELISVPGARLITGLSPAQQLLVTQQVDRLSGQWDSTASESTF